MQTSQHSLMMKTMTKLIEDMVADTAEVGEFFSEDVAVDEDDDLADILGETLIESETFDDFELEEASESSDFNSLFADDIADLDDLLLTEDDATDIESEDDMDDLFAAITTGGDTKGVIQDTELAPEFDWISDFSENADLLEDSQDAVANFDDLDDSFSELDSETIRTKSTTNYRI